MSPEAAELERKVVAVWRDVLGLSSLASDETFFDAGGTSLLAARLACRLENALHRPVSASDLFVYPTPRDLARALRGADPAESDALHTSHESTSSSGVEERAARQRGAFTAFGAQRTLTRRPR
jgi:hypothetical protein